MGRRKRVSFRNKQKRAGRILLATHHFSPTHYYTAIGSHEPVLKIADGDTVVTTTVDASGRDATNERITPGGNPQTGPFYIEGAELGDTLAVHFDLLRPNRLIGYSNTRLAHHVVDPWYVEKFPQTSG